ncbi:MAG TPA: hypothetical protein VGP68_12955 [Gemmataceae bacterium]|jgi:hypothetical protein|nr:hypothetical protein [Gemmataceae bacterium]
MVDAVSRSADPSKPGASRSRWKRRLGFVAATVITLVVAIVVGAKLFLGSQHFKTMLADRLQSVFKGRLRISAVDVGMNSTSVHDVVLVEQTGDKPWAKIEHIEAEMPLLKLLGGAAEAEQVHFHKMDVTLRFDAHNHLLTELPEKQGTLPALPPIHLDDGTLTIAQEGREPFRLANLAGLATSKDGKISFKGTVQDPTWGAWTVAIAYDPESSVSEMTLKSTGVAVKQAMLSALPFVTPKTWTHVECAGKTTAEITFRHAPGEAQLHYHVLLEPTETQVRVTDVDLQAQHAGGKVVIEDGLVTLTNVNGQVADGKIATNATLNFRQPIYDHHFSVTAQNLDLHLLPVRWKIPRTLRGRLTGNADLAVKISDHKHETSGEGLGVIDQAKLGLLPLKEPIHIRLLADEKGFHFLPLLPEGVPEKPDG